jgi:uncharacterized protein DUF4136
MLGALLIITCMGSCKKDPLNHLTNDESRIYITNYDSTANFASYATFSVADSITVIQNNQFAGRSLNDYDAQIIAAVTQQMRQRGYQAVNSKSSPDLAIDLSRVYTTSTQAFSYGDYWDSYDLYWDPYYWGYPDYGFYDPYAVGTYTLTNGGLEIDLLDLKNAAANSNKIKGIWTGMAQGEAVFATVNGANEVSALFNQSPYLKK